MPGSIDGIGLANEIRVRYPGLPIVLSTGYTDSAQKVPDGLHVLRKPFDTDTLTRVIETVMRPEPQARRHQLASRPCNGCQGARRSGASATRVRSKRRRKGER